MKMESVEINFINQINITMCWMKLNWLNLFEETYLKSKLPKITNVQTINAKEGILLL